MTIDQQSAPKTKKPIWKRWWMIVLFVLVGIGLIQSIGSDGTETAVEEPSVEAAPVESETEEPAEDTESEIVGDAAEEEPAAEEPSEEPSEESEPEDAVPSEYRSALRSAETYSDMMHMSKAGIYDQLTSEYGDQFTAEAAQYAIDNIDADWNNNALESAKTYQEMMAMSPAAIHDQLTSEYGDQFTSEEADYAIANLP